MAKWYSNSEIQYPGDEIVIDKNTGKIQYKGGQIEIDEMMKTRTETIDDINNSLQKINKDIFNLYNKYGEIKYGKNGSILSEKTPYTFYIPDIDCAEVAKNDENITFVSKFVDSNKVNHTIKRTCAAYKEGLMYLGNGPFPSVSFTPIDPEGIFPKIEGLGTFTFNDNDPEKNSSLHLMSFTDFQEGVMYLFKKNNNDFSDERFDELYENPLPLFKHYHENKEEYYDSFNEY